MTNKEWRRCRDPVAMIRGLQHVASGRKSLLYMVAGCRTLWPLLCDANCRDCVEVAERFADGRANLQELHDAQHPGECPTFGFDFEPRTWRRWSQDGRPSSSIRRLVEMGVFTERDLENDEFEVDPDVKARLMAAADLAYFTCRENPFRSEHFITRQLPHVDWPGDWLLRCIFGKPFLPPVVLDPS